MVFYIQKLSAILFYLLGLSFFAAYLLEVNDLITWGFWWMRVADMPLAVAAILYGGTSTYLSVRPADKPAPAVAWTISIVLTCAFVILAVMNFWVLLPQN